ncbi:MAG TPA: TonB-dependent receptor [Bacteroidetes bacterium]|nr:TonB-dependent receptor [Bacteroidota bacterium]
MTGKNGGLPAGEPDNPGGTKNTMTRMKRGIIGLAVVLLLAGAARAGLPIRGFVIDGTSGEPLPIANVLIKGSTRGTSTNLDGFFVIPNVPPGEYTLVVSFLGYHSLEFAVEVRDELMEPLTIELLPSAVKLEEVIYTIEEEEDGDLRESPRVSTVAVDPNAIRMMPSLGAEMDVLRALQAIPGVKSSSEISSALYVRGGSPDMTLLLLDRSTVYNPSHLFGLFSTFNADAVKHIELMKGGFPAEYGGRAGSVLEVITKDGNRRKSEGLVSVGIISARASLEGPIPEKRGSFAFSGRRTYFEPVLNMLRKSGEDFADLPSYNFYDANGKVNLDLTPKTTLTLGSYVGRDNFDSEFGPEDSRFKMGMDWGNTTFFSRLRQVVAANSFLSASASYSRYSSGLFFANEGMNLQDFKNGFTDWAFRADAEMHRYRSHLLKTGVQLNHYSVIFNMSSDIDDLMYVDIDTSTSTFSHYVQDTWKLSSHWEIQPGLRWYYHAGAKEFRLDPRLGIVYLYSPELRFKLAGGRYHQWITLLAFGEGLSAFDTWFPNDGTIPPTYSDQVVAGIERDWENGLEFTLEAYYNDLNDVVMYDATSISGNSLADAFLVGDGYAWGFEWMLQRKKGRVQGWLGYSLSWTKRRFPGALINNGDWFYPRWDRRHDFIAVGSYRLNERWTLSTTWRYNTGQGYTRALGIYTQRFAGVGDEYDDNMNRTILYGERNNYRLPADHRLDLTASYHHHLFGKKAALNISIYNVYNRRALWRRSYDTSENPVEVNDIKLLPILPLVSYEVRF